MGDDLYPRRSPNRAPSHPGALLREVVLPGHGPSKTEIADLLGISRQTLQDVFAERQGVTPALAVRLGKLFGQGPRLWLDMQQAHDVWHAERALKDKLERMQTLRSAEEKSVARMRRREGP